MSAASEAQADVCSHGRRKSAECLDCLIDEEEQAFDAVVKQMTRCSERVRALKALRANQGGAA